MLIKFSIYFYLFLFIFPLKIFFNLAEVKSVFNTLDKELYPPHQTGTIQIQMKHNLNYINKHILSILYILSIIQAEMELSLK